MRTLFVLATLACLATATWANVWTTVYRHDEKTPLATIDPNHPTEYRPIMTGTHLTVVVSSDQGGYWWGSLMLPWEDVGRAILTGRGFTPLPLGYPGSCLEAAGDDAEAYPLMGMPELGVEFFSDYDTPLLYGVPSTPGDWFIFDYYAEGIGTCRIELQDLDYYARQMGPDGVEFHELLESFDMPLQVQSFTHVLSRDFNDDKTVDWQDFAVLASQWRSASDPNTPSTTPDLDMDGGVNISDLTLFTDFWLERTDAPEAVTDPNEESR